MSEIFLGKIFFHFHKPSLGPCELPQNFGLIGPAVNLPFIGDNQTSKVYVYIEYCVTTFA